MATLRVHVHLKSVGAGPAKAIGWTSPNCIREKRGVIPKNIPPVIDRLGSSAEVWKYFDRKFGTRCHAPSVTPVDQQAVANGRHTSTGSLA